MSVTASALKFARTQDAANEFRRSSAPAPVADTVATLADWELRECAAFEELSDDLALAGWPVRRQA